VFHFGPKAVEYHSFNKNHGKLPVAVSSTYQRHSDMLTTLRRFAVVFQCASSILKLGHMMLTIFEDRVLPPLNS
jgi:hypothetical protein